MSTNITNNIKHIRLNKGITRVELSKSSGVSVPMLKVLENGEFDITNSKLDTLVKIAGALKVKVSDLLPIEKRKALK